jgi:hypothetical protein
VAAAVVEAVAAAAAAGVVTEETGARAVAKVMEEGVLELEWGEEEVGELTRWCC